MSEVYWEHFAHSADIGIRGVATTKELAFSQAAMAMVAVMVDVGAIEARERVIIRCQDTDEELLLLAWLNAVVYEMDVRHMLFGRFDVRIDRDCLTAEAFGEPMDPARHEFHVEVKAATPAQLRVGQDDQGRWIAQCVVDV
jgi:tRNA nucleotidyltransferase (CCA-adding enzyme)